MVRDGRPTGPGDFVYTIQVSADFLQLKKMFKVYLHDAPKLLLDSLAYTQIQAH